MSEISIRILRLIFIFFLATHVSFGFAQINKNGDFQLWNIDGVFVRITPEWAWLAQTEMRWGDNGNIFYFQYAETTFYYQPKPWFWIGPSYRQEWNYVVDNERPWTTVYSPYIDVSFGSTFSQWNLSTRNFFMYRAIKGSFPSEFRYRNRLQAIFPKVNYFPIWLYVSEEFFIDQRVGFSQNRLIAGAQYTRKDRFRTAIEYMYRNLKLQDWAYQSVLNIRIQLEF